MHHSVYMYMYIQWCFTNLRFDTFGLAKCALYHLALTTSTHMFSYFLVDRSCFKIIVCT